MNILSYCRRYISFVADFGADFGVGCVVGAALCLPVSIEVFSPLLNDVWLDSVLENTRDPNIAMHNIGPMRIGR